VNALLISGMLAFALSADTPTARAITDIRAVGREGAGHDKAQAAAAVLVKQGPNALEPILRAFQDATPMARNWFRMTIDAIVTGDSKADRQAINEPFKSVVRDAKLDPSARAFAYDYLAISDPAFAKSLLPGFINDPSVDLRRLAIADRLAASPAADQLRVLFDATRDKDQAEQIAKLLKDQGVTVDLTAHFGYLTAWQVVGPFDSPQGRGFSESFAAESRFADDPAMTGKAGATLRWKRVQSKAPYAMVNLNQELGKHMDAVAYATAVVKSEKELPCEIRVGSKNAVVMFLNGRKLFEREAYHHGFAMDQHAAPGVLRAGENRIVLKVVQNNQKEQWAQDWAFNLRVCDFTGGKLPITPIAGDAK
jgi:hypothetical protein